MSRILINRLFLLLSLSLLLGGCATSRGNVSAGQRLDPWESWNRKVFGFNESFDANLLKPVATAYSEIVPAPVRQGIDNVFGNISDAWSAVNLVLQGRFKPAVQQTMRFAVNSVLGFAGVLDISSEVGLERNSEDLGKTFGRWGFGTGAYIVWPLLGPSSVRDTLAMPWDRIASPALVVHNGASKTLVTALQLVNTRSNFLRASEMLDGIALDKYTFYRDAYLQRRGSLEDDAEFEVLAPATPATPAAPAAAASAPLSPRAAP